MSDRDDFEAWVNSYPGAAIAGKQSLVKALPQDKSHFTYYHLTTEATWRAWRAARSEAYVLRKQAEAIVKAAEQNGLTGTRADYVLYDDLIADANEMFQKADKLSEKK